MKRSRVGSGTPCIGDSRGRRWRRQALSSPEAPVTTVRDIHHDSSRQKTFQELFKTHDTNQSLERLTKPAYSTNPQKPKNVFCRVVVPRTLSFSSRALFLKKQEYLYARAQVTLPRETLGLLHYTKVEGGLLEHWRAARIALEWGKHRMWLQH